MAQAGGFVGPAAGALVSPVATLVRLARALHERTSMSRHCLSRPTWRLYVVAERNSFVHFALCFYPYSQRELKLSLVARYIG